MLRSKAGRKADGSPASTPSTDANWNTFYPYLKGQVALSSGYDYGVEAWQFALVHAITGETEFSNKAIDWADRFVAARTTDKIGGVGDNRPCVARYPAGLPSTDYASAGTCLASGQFLYAHYFIRNVAFVYDWLYTRLSEAQRTAYRDYLREAVDKMWNNRVDGGWALNDPANNYYYGYVIGTLTQTLATWGEDSAALANWNFLAQQKLPPAFAYLRGAGAGGYWHEGTHYGRKSKVDLMESLLMIRDGSQNRSMNVFASGSFTYPQEMLTYQLHSMQPDAFAKLGTGRYRGTGSYNTDANPPTLVQVGDLANNAQGPVTTSDVALMAMTADGLAGRVQGQAAQYWVHDLSAGIPRTRRARVHEFLFEDPSLARSDFRLAGGIPTTSASTEWFHSRSDWSADATAVSFFSASGPQITSHQHRDQNSFLIWHKGWQAADLNSWGSSGLADETSVHNTLLLNNKGQRNPITDSRYAANDPGYGRIKATHDSAAVSGLRAAIGSAATAYGEPENYGQTVRRTMTRFDRLLVHFKNLVVVGDLVASTGGANDVITYIVHSRGGFTATAGVNSYWTSAPCGESLMSAGACVNDMAKGKMFHTTVLPSNANIRIRSNYSGRSSPTLPGSGLEFDVSGVARAMINVMSLHDVSASSGALVSYLEGTSGFIGTRVASNEHGLVVLFRNDPNGALGSSTSFAISGATANAVLVAGLEPGRYRISRAGVVVNNSAMVDGSGMLSFETPAGSAQIDIAIVR